MKIKNVFTLFILKFLLLGFIITICKASAYSNEETEAYSFSNPYLGLSISIPTGWSEQFDSARINVTEELQNLIPYEVDSKLLLFAVEYPNNDYLSIYVNNARSVPKRFSNAKPYIKHRANVLARDLSIFPEKYYDRQIGNGVFQSLSWTQDSLSCMLLSTIHNDYLINLQVRANSSSELETFLTSLSANLKFSSVSEDIELSAEGIAFREQSTFSFPKKKSFMQELTTIGKLAVLGFIALIIRGLYGILRKIYGKKYPKFFTYFDD